MKTVWFAVPLLMTTFGFAVCASAEIYYPWCANYGGRGGGGTNCGWLHGHDQGYGRLLRSKSILYAAFAKTITAPIQATQLKLDEETRC
jgi:hypothetical protein